MNRLSGIVLAVAMSFTASTFAAESTTADVRESAVGAHVTTAEIVRDATSLDQYTGRYEADGIVFVVVLEENMLTIELPETWAFPQVALRAEGANGFFAAEVPVIVTFQTNDHGQVTGLVAYPPNGQAPLSATKVALRHGIVTIYDVSDVRRGIVTIYDVESTPSATITAAN